MEILVNGQRLDYTLEGEATAAAVRDSLLKLFAPHGRVITGFRVDGSDEPAALTKPVGEVKELRVEVAEVNALVLDTLGGAGEYLSRILKTAADIEALDPAQQPVEAGLIRLQLADGLGWVVKVLRNCAYLLKAADPGLAAGLAEAESAAAALAATDDRAAALRLIRETVAPLAKRLRQQAAELTLGSRGSRVTADELRRGLARFQTELPAMSARVVAVAATLQTGQEFKALQLFQEEIATLQAFIAFLQAAQQLPGLDFTALAAGGQSLADRVQALLDLLKKIVETFAHKDYVLLADLLEYELAPMIDAWRGTLPLLEQSLPRP